MTAATEKIAVLIPKLRPNERQAVRSMLDAADFKKWEADTVKFHLLMRGKQGR
jgi:hypothetical protein